MNLLICPAYKFGLYSATNVVHEESSDSCLDSAYSNQEVSGRLRPSKKLIRQIQFFERQLAYYGANS
jgi:hypothetical protein